MGSTSEGELEQHLKPTTGSDASKIVLAVYAPFGDDQVLSTYPDGGSSHLLQHPLVRHLAEVAEAGVAVTALVDRAEADTYLVEIPAGDGDAVCATSRWKLDMATPHTLAGFLVHTQHRHPDARVVLCLEGHGAGYLPEIDSSALTADAITGDGKYTWSMCKNGAQVTPVPPEPGDAPPLPIKSPVLPIKSPVLPGGMRIMSTYGLGMALARARHQGAGKLAVVHFNNCFNFSLELLHTIAPYAEYAVGYASYNFFTAGEAYPHVFSGSFADKPILSNAELAQRFALNNHLVLSKVRGHPTIGAVVPLDHVNAIVDRLDDLAQSLIQALPANLDLIAACIQAALQYDTTSANASGADFLLEVPDDLTDLRDFARGLMQSFPNGSPVHADAAGLFGATEGLKAYGDTDVPWPNPAVTWDFSGDVAVNIFLPNPRRTDLWDWRTPYYLNVTQDAVQPHIIDFLKSTAWVDFVLKYHESTPFKGLRAAQIPAFPTFNPRAPEIIDRYRQGPRDQSPPKTS